MNQNPTPINIDRNVTRTCVAFSGLCGQQAEPDGDIVIRIRRAGTQTHTIEYPATIENGQACFEWGELMYSLAPGRYIGDLFDDDQPVGAVQFQLHPQGWVVSG